MFVLVFKLQSVVRSLGFRSLPVRFETDSRIRENHEFVIRVTIINDYLRKMSLTFQLSKIKISKFNSHVTWTIYINFGHPFL